ncbi:MAG: mechanosensitive ion channel [Flavobacteriaceae bacterium]|nr:mechanosensitive ion channel [Flavobacteriaceae bacterium]
MSFIFYGIFHDDFMNALRQFIKLFNHTFTIGESISFTPKSILIVILVFVLTTLLLKIFRKIIYRTLSDDARVKFKSVFSFFNYFVYTVVVLLTFQNIGVNLTAVFAASAALLVGVGLALQTFIQDIISGIFILVDQSVHVGDIIEVDGQVGKVENIKLRTTRAVTRENKVLIIPNHKFLTSILFNWTENGVITKEFVAVGVSYDTDAEKVTELLLEIAEGHKAILKKPIPQVIFSDFGDSALQFQLYFALSSSFVSNLVKSDLRYSILLKFKEENIEIPFPQRTLNFVNPPKSLQ